MGHKGPVLRPRRVGSGRARTHIQFVHWFITLSSASVLGGGVGGQRHLPADLSPWKAPILYEVGWAPEQVWTNAQNLAPHWDLIPGP